MDMRLKPSDRSSPSWDRVVTFGSISIATSASGSTWNLRAIAIQSVSIWSSDRKVGVPPPQ